MARELTPQEQMVFKELCIRAFYGVKVGDNFCSNGMADLYVETLVQTM